MNLDEKIAFEYEIKNWGNIPISSKNCGIGCLFCKVHVDPLLKRFATISPINEEDLIQGFQLINESHGYVRLGAGVMVAAHTDPFLHPKIYDFIKMASDYFPDKRIRTVTTGSYIEESKVNYLNSINNYGIDLSLITMQEQRETIIPKPTRSRIEYLLRNAPLKKISLMYTGNLSAVRKDLDMLISLGWHIKAKEILVRRIESSKYNPKKLNQLSIDSIASYRQCIDMLKVEYPFVKFTLPALTSDYYHETENEYFIEADERIIKIKNGLLNNTDIRFNLVCSESSFEYFSNSFLKNDNVKVHLVKNELYGGSVSVAGLLNHFDIKRTFLNTSLDGTIILPKEMYDLDQNDISGENINVLKQSLKQDVILA